MDTTSNVGGSQTYGADDKWKVPQSEVEERERFKEGEANSHKALDAKDERTIANKLERESQREREKDEEKSFEDMLHKKDATLPAKMHGNEPSKGAKIDQELREEEAEILKKKGKFGPNVD